MSKDSMQPQIPAWTSVTGQTLDLGRASSFSGRCATISDFEKLNRLGEGTYGVVFRARHKKTSDIVALKQVRILPEERQNGIPITALREISILRSLRHQNIVNVLDVAVGLESLEDIYMVMEYAEQDMAVLLDEQKVKFTMGQVKCLFRQVLEGIEYLHRNDIIHRDVKMQNILLTSKGTLKLADFGMAREYSPRPLTPGVVTIWYRSPELLLGTKRYTPAVDLWSAGLILAELLLSAPCLPGESEIEQLTLIVKLLGTPSPEDLSAFSEMGCPQLISWRSTTMPQGRVSNLERRFLHETSRETVRYLSGFLEWDPGARYTATEALGRGRSRFATDAQKWWKESPREVTKELLPTFPELRNVHKSSEARNEWLGAKHAGKPEPQENSKPLEGNSGYVFDFDEGSQVRRPTKRHRAR
ncbi:Pkinase-domain-containing protein [Xylona heveae TC161]|uniref:cyclin-dependent kinase n=1 Tax=Xylona heveae (strain CBS 132557 / TC161) TaxID=1328760 RepID=A0A164ZFR5_XYLHT|nr:Pkinase-domain-containing protein [Xylona heveae TC161]KZF19046.1 Pkinase-domain-containing protein [Xylona heveae TC161]